MRVVLFLICVICQCFLLYFIWKNGSVVKVYINIFFLNNNRIIILRGVFLVYGDVSNRDCRFKR